MNDTERSNPLEEGIMSAVRGQLARTWTALPGIIQSFDADAQTAVVQPAIKAEVTNQDGSKSLATLPLLLDCPVQFPGGGDTVITFPVVADDECLVIFASRCIDAWWESSGVQPQAELRMHDLSDGFVLLGYRSKPKATPSPSATATELRSLDGATVVSLDPAAQTITLTAPGGIFLNGPVTADSTITAATEVTADGINLSTHTHGGVDPGAAETDPPTP